MRSYEESDMQLAVAEVESGDFSARSAAARHGIPKQSLLNRLSGSRPAPEAHDGEKKLTNAQELILVSWILDLSAGGHSPNHAFTKRIAERIAGEAIGER